MEGSTFHGDEKMKKYVTCLLCVLVLTVGCTKYIKSEKTRISDSLLKALSRDLAEINTMVENAREESKEEVMLVKVLKPWTASPGVKYKIATASGEKVFDVMAKSRIEAPTVKGYAIAELLKLRGPKEEFIGVASPGIYGTIQAAAPRESLAGGYPIKFYDPALAHDAKSFEAIRQYVSLTSTLEKTAEKILKKLAELKEKYLESPIVIEGFTIHLPLISIEIQFKFRT